MQREKVRVYELARELDMQSKDLLDLCRLAGMDVKNQLSSVDRDAVEALIRKGNRAGGVAVGSASSASALPTDLSTKVRVLTPNRRRAEGEPAAAVPADKSAAPQEQEAPAAAVAATPPKVPAEAPAAKIGEPGVAPVPRSGDGPVKVPSLTGKVPSLGSQRTEGGQRPRRDRQIRPVVARVAQPPRKSLFNKEPKKLEPVAQKPIARPPDVSRGGTPVHPKDLTMLIPPPPPIDVEDEDEEDKGKKNRPSPGGVAGRDARHRQRADRAKQRKDRVDTDVRGGRVLTAVDEDRPQRVKTRLREHKKPRPITEPRRGKVPVDLPITVRALSKAIGVPVGDLLFRLRAQGASAAITINSSVEPTMAEAVALDAGCELEVRRAADIEYQVLAELEKPDEPEDLVPRPPVVTIMGHVDHGKTTLLDKIRKTNIAATETGGITQVIRAWRVEHGGRPVTFLDTPGHEAFTKMRARGAQVTDIAVIVVAADDGVMPQTEEAINHARAAGVPIVVAINKIDLPNANLNKTRQQLYNLQLIPDTMGGDTPFVETSAATGKGIDELLDMLSLVAETMLELKTNSQKPARGTCLEAMLTEGEGVLATLLVRDGTLHQGEVVLCGATYGRVRAMYDDLGRPIQDAGPSTPVRITGLDPVPNADDPFMVVPDLSSAREIAEKRQAKRQEASIIRRAPITLENLSEAKVAELKIILKADFRGSIEAITKEMEKLKHDEVRINLLHTGIGAISESDVVLALTSPEDTIIVGFNVVPDDRAHILAEERGVQIRQYNIIYNLTDEIRSALEGKLKPHEQIIHLGRAVVRKIFKVGRVGTVAGSYVTQGTIERSAKVRLIRAGVVIYPPPDRTAGLDSLKRVKEDVREVREGFECGIKIAGYDDIKVDDVIEAYRIEQVQRTL